MNPGTQVICTNGDFSELLNKNPSIAVPIENRIYIVRDRFNFIAMTGITLEEIHNVPIKGSKIEPNFNINRFALLSEVDEMVLEEEKYLQAA